MNLQEIDVEKWLLLDVIRARNGRSLPDCLWMGQGQHKIHSPHGDVNAQVWQNGSVCGRVMYGLHVHQGSVLVPKHDVQSHEE